MSEFSFDEPWPPGLAAQYLLGYVAEYFSRLDREIAERAASAWKDGKIWAPSDQRAYKERMLRESREKVSALTQRIREAILLGDLDEYQPGLLRPIDAILWAIKQSDIEVSAECRKCYILKVKDPTTRAKAAIRAKQSSAGKAGKRSGFADRDAAMKKKYEQLKDAGHPSPAVEVARSYCISVRNFHKRMNMLRK